MASSVTQAISLLTRDAVTNTMAANGACDFDGNDLGGIGSVVAYTSIAVATTILAVFAIVYYVASNDDNDNDKEESDSDSRESPTLGADVFDLSLGFWDTVVWFGIAGAIAGFYSLWKYEAESIYEIVLTVLVTCMLLNATAALSSLYLFKDAHKESNHKIRVLAQVLAVLVNIVVVFMGWYVESSWNGYLDKYKELKDRECYGPNDHWARQDLTYAVGIQQFIILVVLAYGALFFGVWWRSQQPNGVSGYRAYSWLTAILGIVFTIAMWADFGLVILVRKSADTTFAGTSFSQNDLSYGQLVAAGLPVQFLFYLIGIFIRHGTS